MNRTAAHLRRRVRHLQNQPGTFDEGQDDEFHRCALGMCGGANPAALEFVPAQFPQNPFDPAKFPHFSRKRGLLKSFVYIQNARKLLRRATLTR